MEATVIREAKVVVGKQYCENEERELTVRKTSLFFSGDGFAAYDHHTGDLVFRVDTYGRGPGALTDELVLMDPAGASIITLRRKVSTDLSFPLLFVSQIGFDVINLGSV